MHRAGNVKPLWGAEDRGYDGWRAQDRSSLAPSRIVASALPVPSLPTEPECTIVVVILFRIECDITGCPAYVTLAPELFDGLLSTHDIDGHDASVTMDGGFEVPDEWSARDGKHYCPHHTSLGLVT